jgi:hypothetical protein
MRKYFPPYLVIFSLIAIVCSFLFRGIEYKEYEEKFKIIKIERAYGSHYVQTFCEHEGQIKRITPYFGGQMWPCNIYIDAKDGAYFIRKTVYAENYFFKVFKRANFELHLKNQEEFLNSVKAKSGE